MDVLEGVHTLVDANLVRQEARPNGTTRYRMLEPVRADAAERLTAAGLTDVVRARHADYFQQLAARDRPYIFGSDSVWVMWLHGDDDNIRAALHWAYDRSDAGLLVRLAGALWPYWLETGRYRDGLIWLATALDLVGSLPVDLRAPLLLGRFLLTYSAGDFVAATAMGEASLACSQEVGDHYGQALTLEYQAWLTQNQQRDIAGAIALHEQALIHWQALGDIQAVAQAHNDLAFTLALAGRSLEAEDHFAQSLRCHEQAENAFGICRVWADRGTTALARGDIVVACQQLTRALALARPLPYPMHLAYVLCSLGGAELFAGRLEEAKGHLSESLQLRAEGEGYDQLGIAYCLIALGGIAGRQDNAISAARLCGAAETLFQSIGGAILPGVQTQYERELQLLQTKLTPAEFAAAWAAGQQLPLDQAVAEALAFAENA
jgi:tetratricopeptide (TPR) repeat protein